MPTPRCILVFDLGGVLIDWNPRHLSRKLFADEAAMEDFLATVCTSEWNVRQDAGRRFAEAAALLKAEHPGFRDPLNAYFARSHEIVAGDIARPRGSLGARQAPRLARLAA